MLGPDRHILRAEERAAELHGSGKRLFGAIGGATHHTDQARPVDLRRAFQFSRPRIAESRNIRQHQDVADLIEPAAAGASKHLE